MIRRTAPLRRLLAPMLASVLCGALAGCGSNTHPGFAAPMDGPRIWASSADGTRKLAIDTPPALAITGPDNAAEAIVIDPADRRQQVVGYGAAMTDASAELFEQVLKPDERERLFAELFGADGLALNFVRVPIGASDFSSQHYSLDDLPAGQTDPQLRRFSMDRVEAAQLPALQAVKRANPGLVLMASPWSAPGWMKSTDSLIKGQLRDEFYPAYAAYFTRYLDAMEQAGLPIRYVSIQNEPLFEPHDYPGMHFPAAARARFIGQYLGPALAARRLPVGILDWDHNWDHPEEPLAVLADPVANRHVTGIAWHCYAGDPAAMQAVHAAHPGKEVFFSECSGGEWAPDWGPVLGWMIDNLIIAPTRAGSRGTLLWNLALDERHGPHLGGCGNCRGVVTINRQTRAITRNVEYYALAHVSRFVRPGAHVLQSRGGGADVTHAAFSNPDGSVVVLLHNRADTAKPQLVRAGAKAIRLALPAGEVVTLVWPAR